MMSLTVLSVCAADYDYPYLTIEKSDGTTYTLPLTSLSFTVSDGGLRISSTEISETLSSADLSKMYFAKPANVTIPAIGWATLYSDCTLDVSDSQLTAYTASFGDESATLSPVNAIPAHTGIILKGTAGDYSLPIAASASAVVGNDLSGTTSGLAAGDNYYALTTYNNAVVFAQVSSGVVIPAGKAFYAGSSLSRPYYIIDGSMTGISNIPLTLGSEDESGKVYSLSGQQVSRPRKGIYIVHGKKVVVK